MYGHENQQTRSLRTLFLERKSVGEIFPRAECKHLGENDNTT